MLSINNFHFSVYRNDDLRSNMDLSLDAFNEYVIILQLM